MTIEFTPGGVNTDLYNGNEIQDETQGTMNLDWYDYGARAFATAKALTQNSAYWSIEKNVYL